MQQEIAAFNDLDGDGNPGGGTVSAPGLIVQWQNGPLGRGDDRREPNGCFVETVIAAALQRIRFYQGSRFSCRENSLAVTKLEEALHWLQARTARREREGVEGLNVEDARSATPGR